ncbi:MAG: extracellular solute-binding protein [Treponema sp.]|jgi:putative aldouronate transport system substrate-binding protein|nr:extracellular solute-binding protein [Treponema sp.]
MNRKLSLASIVVALFVCLVSCGKSGGDGTAVEIVVEVFDRGTDGGKSNPVNNNWTAWIQEKALKDEGIRVTFTAIPRWSENTAMNNLMAAGNPPDVCLSYSPELIGNFRDLGGLLDISPYIDTTLKDLKAFLGPDKALPGRDLIRRNEDPVTKTVYSIPARRVVTAQRSMFIRKDWLDALGLPLPSTTEEYHQALKAFKEQDPGGVGKNRVIPLGMGSDIFWGAYNIGYSFIEPNLSIKDRWVTTIVERSLLLPGYKEGVRFLNTLYQEGLIDRDFALYKGEEMTAVLKSGVVGSFCGEWDTIYRESDSILTDLRKNIPNAEFVPVDALTGSDGSTHKSAYDSAGINFFIPASCKNPEAALRYVNWLAKYENYYFLQTGPEGIVHDMVDGIPKLKEGPGLWIQNSPLNLDYAIHVNGLDLGDPELNIRALASGYPWPFEKIQNAYTIAMTNAAPLPVIPVQLSAAGPVSQILVDKHNALLAELMICRPKDFDQVWDKRLAEWMASGAKAVLDERTAKYVDPY